MQGTTQRSAFEIALAHAGEGVRAVVVDGEYAVSRMAHHEFQVPDAAGSHLAASDILQRQHGLEDLFGHREPCIMRAPGMRTNQIAGRLAE
jgi:hypothetical protein